MPENTFDIVSKVELPEVVNAIQQALKEIQTRFDLKDSRSKIELNEKDSKLTLTSADEFKLKAVNEVLEQKLVKRKVPLKAFSYGPIEDAAGSTVRQEVTMQQGIPDGEGARDRQGHQGHEEEGAGVHPGRPGACQRQGSRYAPGDHGDAAAA
jgi:cyclic-di-GMP-binding protein